jgi:hypothetical protein
MCDTSGSTGTCGDMTCRFLTNLPCQAAIDTIEESWKGTEREGKKVDVTRLNCDHVPVYSGRDELEKWMEGLIVAKGESRCESYIMRIADQRIE